MPPKSPKSKDVQAGMMIINSGVMDILGIRTPPQDRQVAPVSSSSASANAPILPSDPSDPVNTSLIGSTNQASNTKVSNETSVALDTAAKDGGNVVWVALSTALQGLEKRSSAIPPLSPLVSALLDCIGTISDANQHRQEYCQLASDLTLIVNSLGQRLTESNSTQMSQSVQNLINNIQAQIEHIASRQQRHTLARYIEAARDEEDLIECYRRIETWFQQLQVDATMNIWNNTNDIQNSVNDIRNSTTKVRSNTNEQLEIMRLDRLAPAIQARYNSAQATMVRRRMCTLGTRTSIRKELREWADDPDSPNVYWLNGMAGTGKTTIVYSFCDELEKSCRLEKSRQLEEPCEPKKSCQLGASFFCSRLLPECRDVNRLVPTIAYQLAKFSSAFRSALCEILREDHDLGSYNLDTQLSRLVRDPLLAAKNSIPTNVVIVVDALDELSNNGDSRAFLDTVFRYVSDLPVKFFVTSRPEPGIRDKMRSRDGQSRAILYLHDIERSLVQADIELYLQDELQVISPSHDQVRQLADQAGSLFIYAATAVRYIMPDSISVDPHRRLKTMLQMNLDSSSNKHRDIDALYTAILAGALGNPDLEPEEANDIRLVLYAAVCVKEPLDVKALASLLGLGHERRVVSALEPLRSVLHVSESTGMVSTLHASFPDFMLNDKRSGVFYCDVAQTSEVLAERCFMTMEGMLRFNICDLESSYVFDADVPNLDDRISQTVPPELVYACRYWGSHLEATNSSESLCGLLEQFLSIRLLFWMEVLNLKRCIGSGEAVLCEAQKWLEICGISSDTLKLIKDARKFVTTFAANPISQSTPHLYISALPFWRKESPVSMYYWKKTRGLVQIDGAVTSGSASALVATWLIDTPVHSISFSPSGNCLVSGSGDGAIRVWDSQTGTVVSGPFEGHTQEVSVIAFSSDGTRIASGSRDCTIRVWDVQSGALLRGPFEGHTNAVRSVAFSPDGAHIVSGSEDCNVRVWDSHTGVPVAGPFQGHTGTVHAAAFSPDGARIISGSGDRTIRVWDAQTGAVVSEPFEVCSEKLRSLALSPSGTLAASVSTSSSLDVCDTRTGKQVPGPFRYIPSITYAAFSRDGTQFLSVTADWSRIWSGYNGFRICVWDVRTGTLTSGPFEGHTSDIHAAAFSPDGTRIVSCSSDKTIRVWDTQFGLVAPSQFEGPTTFISSLAFSADGTCVVSCSRDGTFCVWDAQSGLLRSGPFRGDGVVSRTKISADATRIAHYSDWGPTFIWDAQTGAKLSGPFIIGIMLLVAFSPDGTRIASNFRDLTIRVWDARDGSLISTSSEQYASSVTSISFSPDGARTAAGFEDHTIRIWDAHTGATLSRPFQGHTGLVCALAFSSNGNLVASGSADATVRVWDAWAGTMASGPLEGHTGPVKVVVFSSDNGRVISGSDDNTIRIWDAQTGALIFGLFGRHTRRVTSIALSPDGTCIASGSEDTTIRIWNTKFAALPTVEDWRMESDGWVVTRCDSKLLLWVPPALLNGLYHPQNTVVVCARGTFKLDFSSTLHGTHWHECYVR